MAVRYTDDQHAQIRSAVRELKRRGHTHQAYALWEKYVTGKTRVTQNELATLLGGVVAEKPVSKDEDLIVPARSGPLSRREHWTTFAKKTSTIDPDVIDNLSVREIIEELENRGIIPKEHKPE